MATGTIALAAALTLAVSALGDRIGTYYIFGE